MLKYKPLTSSLIFSEAVHKKFSEFYLKTLYDT